MTPNLVSERVILTRLALIERLVADVRALPLARPEAFYADTRNVWTAESCLRRMLEALLDIGRHILAKGYGLGTTEYREIAQMLHASQVLDADEERLLAQMAGYRNRMVHLYHQISHEELYQIAAERLGDVERIAGAYRRWLSTHPERVDRTL